jgi:diguanylate cyclase
MPFYIIQEVSHLLVLSRKKLLIYFTLFYTLGYYSWIFYWKNNEKLRILGGNIFSTVAPLITAIVLFIVYKKIKNKQNKYFWLLISFGCFSCAIAEGIWDYYENILKVEAPFPGFPDLFYMLQVVFYLLAFLFKIWYKRETLLLVKFIFDTCIIMIVAISFSWYFIIHDILSQHGSALYIFVSLGYPVGDLILILAAVSFYIGSEYFFSPKVLYLIFGSLIIQVYADSAYLYLAAKSLYISGGPYDPLWALAVLVMGIAGTYSLSAENEKKQEEITKEKNKYFIKAYFSFRLLFPYLNVIILFLVIIIQRKEFNSLIIGLFFSIFLVIIRQIFTLLDNQTLLTKYQTITEELSNKNQQLINAVQKMKHMAYHDVLSGLPNRRLFLEQLTNAIAEAKQNSYKLAVIFIDLDRFKNINDTLGHDIGDLLLKQVSKQISRSLGNKDTVSRQGGDEFTILLSEIPNELEIIALIKQIQSFVGKSIRIKEHELHVSMSMGIAVYPRDGSGPEELMKHADMAMYSAKEQGGNTFRFYSTKMNENIARKVSLENGLRNAIDNNEFILHYQPQVNIATGEIVGMEALLRWNTGNGEVISPGEFIPLAEETRLIIPIGEWVLYNACKQAKIWHDMGHHHLKLAVNLSSVQFLHENAVDMVSKILEETGFNPYYLEIEITEGVAVLDAEEAIMKMQALRDLGVQISIDDFGTGYSSLIYLKRFPINRLKIAQPFIQDIIKSTSDESLVNTIISMAHSLGLSVIAEGVETREQFQTLIDLDCDEVQGYIFSKPLTIKQFNMMLESGALPNQSLIEI